MAELLKATGIYYRNELRSIHKNGVKLAHPINQGD